jgi:hypothetical protein
MTVKDANQNVVSAYGELINPGDFISSTRHRQEDIPLPVTNTDLWNVVCLTSVEHPNYGSVAASMLQELISKLCQIRRGLEATIPVTF